MQNLFKQRIFLPKLIASLDCRLIINILMYRWFAPNLMFILCYNIDHYSFYPLFINLMNIADLILTY